MGVTQYFQKKNLGRCPKCAKPMIRDAVGKYYKCFDCKETVEIPKRPERAVSIKIPTKFFGGVIIPCKDCSGTGRIFAANPSYGNACTSCKGKGSLRVSKWYARSEIKRERKELSRETRFLSGLSNDYQILQDASKQSASLDERESSIPDGDDRGDVNWIIIFVLGAAILGLAILFL